MVKTLLQPKPLPAKIFSMTITILLSISIGFGIQLGINALSDRPLIFAFFASVLFVGWRSGFGAGLLTILLSCLVAQFFIFEPAMNSHYPRTDDLWTLISFAVVSTFGVWFTSQSSRNAAISSLAQTELQTTLKSIGDLSWA